MADWPAEPNDRVTVASGRLMAARGGAGAG